MIQNQYKLVGCEESATGFTVLLDGKPALTPLKRPLIVPTRALAETIASEWHSYSILSPAHGNRDLDPTLRGGDKEKLAHEIAIRQQKDKMTYTQFACIALDLIADKRTEVMQELVGYGETDLVSYRAEAIPELQKQQDAAFAPILAWLNKRYGITLAITTGLMPIPQPAANEALFAKAVASYDDWQLAALAVAVKPLGSLVLGLALMEGLIAAPNAFQLSQLEESYETKQWGQDQEKELRTNRLSAEIDSVGHYLTLLK